MVSSLAQDLIASAQVPFRLDMVVEITEMRKKSLERDEMVLIWSELFSSSSRGNT